MGGLLCNDGNAFVLKGRGELVIEDSYLTAYDPVRPANRGTIMARDNEGRLHFSRITLLSKREKRKHQPAVPATEVHDQAVTEAAKAAAVGPLRAPLRASNPEMEALADYQLDEDYVVPQKLYSEHERGIELVLLLPSSTRLQKI